MSARTSRELCFSLWTFLPMYTRTVHDTKEGKPSGFCFLVVSSLFLPFICNQTNLVDSILYPVSPSLDVKIHLCFFFMLHSTVLPAAPPLWEKNCSPNWARTIDHQIIQHCNHARKNNMYIIHWWKVKFKILFLCRHFKKILQLVV